MTPLSFVSFAETFDVSVAESTEIKIIALVAFASPVSIVNFLMIPPSVRFFTLLLTADSERPSFCHISTKDSLEFFFNISIIASSILSLDISSLFLFS